MPPAVVAPPAVVPPAVVLPPALVPPALVPPVVVPPTVGVPPVVSVPPVIVPPAPALAFPEPNSATYDRSTALAFYDTTPMASRVPYAKTCKGRSAQWSSSSKATLSTRPATKRRTCRV
ncbi:hypothetical protein [Massilia aquatica]|uniref:hypothetical protein n=1 Tax=Massilia aquatica TaxID=2609000 RepID=UPI001651F1C7|nr:hypothetical protein [Massilia aquatica]